MLFGGNVSCFVLVFCGFWMVVSSVSDGLWDKDVVIVWLSRLEVLMRRMVGREVDELIVVIECICVKVMWINVFLWLVYWLCVGLVGYGMRCLVVL